MKSLKIDKGEIIIDFTDASSRDFIEYDIENKSLKMPKG